MARDPIEGGPVTSEAIAEAQRRAECAETARDDLWAELRALRRDLNLLSQALAQLQRQTTGPGA